MSSTQLPRPLPEKMRVEEDERSLRISWRWFTEQHVLLLLCCLCWNGFLVLWYGNVRGFRGHVVGWGAVLFPLLHVAAGVWLTYTTLSGLVNRTKVELTTSERPGSYRNPSAVTGKLAVRHGPIPWRGNLSLAAEDVRRLFVASRDVKVGKRGRKIVHDLFAVDRSETPRPLLVGVEHGIAVSVKALLDRRLGLTDG